MARLIILFIITFLVYVALRGLLAKKNLSVKQFFAIYVATLAGLLLLYLGFTGRLHPVAAIVGAALPFLTRVTSLVTRGAQFAAMFRFLKNMGLGAGATAAGAPNPPDTSEIRSRYIHMVLFHDTGLIDGTVLEGQFENAKLSQLELAQLIDLLKEIQNDQDSMNLLIAYLEREHPDWQSEADIRKPPPASDTTMDEAQALDILGLDADASRNDVIQAHRRMMQKMHPDRGGSTYLAAKINAAKEILLTTRPSDE